MHGLTTIAAIPRTGGAGMALRGETNARSVRYINSWWGGNYADRIPTEREARDLALLRGPTPERNLQDWNLVQQQEEDRLSVLRGANLDWEGMPCTSSWRRIPCS